MADDVEAVCKLCGEPMPKGEEMFKYHGYSGPCPTPAKLPAPTPVATGEGMETPLDMQNARNWIICATEHPDTNRRDEAVRLIAEGLAAISKVDALESRLAAEIAKNAELEALAGRLTKDRDDWARECGRLQSSPSDPEGGAK